MNIIITLKSGKPVKPGQYLPKSTLVGDNLPDRCTLMPATNSDADGREIIITGESYIINSRTYDLGTSGYGLKALLTKDNRVIPYLREAWGAERNLIRDSDGRAINTIWPIIMRLWEEPEEIPSKPAPHNLNTFDFSLLDDSQYDNPDEEEEL